jgi:uncharacterized protein YpuA (DUF1002 family)
MAADLGSKTIREVLKQKVKDEAALDRVLKKVNDAYDKGTTGDQLKKIFKDAMQTEKYDISKEESGILYGFYVP